MDVTTTIEAIRNHCPSFDKRVFGSAQIAQIDLEKFNPTGLPACYVMCIRENSGSPNQCENGFYQEIDARVAVVIMVSNHDDERGQRASTKAERLKEEIIKGICGWSPTGDPQAIYEFDQMWVLANNRAVLAIQLEFLCTYALGYADSRIPDQLNEDCGNFDTVVADVDKIETPPGAPDGHIDTHFEVHDLYGDSGNTGS